MLPAIPQTLPTRLVTATPQEQMDQLQIIFKVLNDKNLPRTTQTFLFRFILLFMCTFNIIFNITVLIMFSFFSYFCLRIFIRWKINTAFPWSVIVF